MYHHWLTLLPCRCCTSLFPLQASVSSVGGGDEEVRAKVREQLVAALQKATDELQVRGRVY